MSSKHVLFRSSRLGLLCVALLGSMSMTMSVGCGGEENKSTDMVAPTPLIEDSMKNQAEFMKKQQGQAGQP